MRATLHNCHPAQDDDFSQSIRPTGPHVPRAFRRFLFRARRESGNLPFQQPTDEKY